MSLIEEALRRVRGPLTPPPPTSPATSPQASQEERAHSWPTTPPPGAAPPAAGPAMTHALTAVAWTVLTLTLVLIVGGVFWFGQTLTRRASPTPTADTSAFPDASSEVPAPADMNNAAPPTAHRSGRPPEFLVTGVVEGLGDPYAVINGSIVAVGERVGGATLLEIRQGNVKLRLADGKEATVRLTR